MRKTIRGDVLQARLEIDDCPFPVEEKTLSLEVHPLGLREILEEIRERLENLRE